MPAIFSSHAGFGGTAILALAVGLVSCDRNPIPDQSQQKRQPRVITLKLAANPSIAVTAKKGEEMPSLSSEGTRFRIVPGLNHNSEAVSLELADAPGHFLRHQRGAIKLQGIPKDRKRMFEDDASWLMVELGDGKVRFESTNFRGFFISVIRNQRVVTLRNAAMNVSTFLIESI